MGNRRFGLVEFVAFRPVITVKETGASVVRKWQCIAIAIFLVMGFHLFSPNFAGFNKCVNLTSVFHFTSFEPFCF